MLRFVNKKNIFGKLFDGTIKKRCLSTSSVQEFSEYLDVTSQKVRCHQDSLSIIDNCIVNFIDENKSNSNDLIDALKQDPTSPFLNILALYDYQIHKTVSLSKNIPNIFNYLNKLAEANLLTDREQYLTSAALEWNKGDYYKAGVILERILSFSKEDLLAVKLAQRAYILAGQDRHALGCVIRHPLAFKATNGFFQTLLLGMLSTGFYMNGRNEEAEYNCKRGLSISSVSNFSLMSSLLISHYLVGKSSEIIEAADEYEKKYQDDAAQNLTLLKGSSYVMRGNCNKAFQSIFATFVENEEQVKAYTLTTLLNASMLNLHALLYLTPDHKIHLDLINEKLEEYASKVDTSSYSPIIQSIILSSSMVSLDTGNVSKLIDFIADRGAVRKGSSSTSSDSSKSSWNLFGMFDSSKKTKESDIQSYEPSDLNQFTPSELDLSSDIAKANEALLEHLKSLELELSSLSAIQVTDSFPSLSLSNVTFPRFLSFNLHESSSRIVKHKQSCLLLAKAIALYGLKQYEESVQILLPFYYENFSSSGLNSLHRDIIQQSLHTCLILAGRYEEAFELLHERSILYPNDGQTWKKIAQVQEFLGNKKLAEEAKYTAWQLGMGQGGFGGTK